MAYAADIARLKRDGPFGPRDDVWLLLAHALTRLGALPFEEQRGAFAPMADTIAAGALALGLPADSMEIRAARALAELGDQWAVTDSGDDPTTALVVATQAVAESQERAGASGLAFAMLHALLGTVGDRIAPRLLGHTSAQQARAARELGFDLVASDLYSAAERIGLDCGAEEVTARGINGLGVLAITRGNYPEARTLFQRALTHADRASHAPQLRHAHHGLMNCGLASGDLDAALIHGWNVLRLCIDPDARAEALLNIGEVCLKAHEYETALRVYAVSMAATSQQRLRVHALANTARAAVELGQLGLANECLTELHETLPSISDLYTQASLRIDMADAHFRLGDQFAARHALDEARRLANAHSYHELSHRAEQAECTWGNEISTPEPTPRPARRRRQAQSERFRTVLRSLNGLTAASL